MRVKDFFENFSAIPGLPTTMYFSGQNPTQIGVGLYKGIDTTQTPNRAFFYWMSPMGVFQSKGTPVASETQATDTSDLQNVFNQVFAQINGWLKSNGFAGSGNVETAEQKSGYAGFNLAANASDGYGGYMTGLNVYNNFLNTVTDPNFKITNAKGGSVLDQLADVVLSVGSTLLGAPGAGAAVGSALGLNKAAGTDTNAAPPPIPTFANIPPPPIPQSAAPPPPPLSEPIINTTTINWKYILLAVSLLLLLGLITFHFVGKSK
jgi:hypothetical protein